MTIATASLTGLPANHRDFDLPLARMLHAAARTTGARGASGRERGGFRDRLAEELERLIVGEGADTIAAMIAEPVWARAA